MTTQHDIIVSEALHAAAPILRETALLIADPQVRYIGTIGGNAANGDPGNDMPALLMALDASYALRSAQGERSVKAREYYRGAYDTAAQPGEILAAIRIPAPPPRHGYAYEKLKRKVGDYATAAAAVLLTVENGRVASCAIGLTNVADRPLLAEDAGESRDRHRARQGGARQGRRGCRSHRFAGGGRPRLRRISHQDGRRDDAPRAPARLRPRPSLTRPR